MNYVWICWKTENNLGIYCVDFILHIQTVNYRTTDPKNIVGLPYEYTRFIHFTQKQLRVFLVQYSKLVHMSLEVLDLDFEKQKASI